jgi:plasmid stabilization system protein ParE
LPRHDAHATLLADFDPSRFRRVPVVQAKCHVEQHSHRERLRKERHTMPRGDKSSYTSKQKRKAEHIEEGYEKRGVGKREAERRAWATVNKETGGGKKSGSGRGRTENRSASRKGGRKGGSRSRSRSSK